MGATRGTLALVGVTAIAAEAIAFVHHGQKVERQVRPPLQTHSLNFLMHMIGV
jgi:hypothetical protein